MNAEQWTPNLNDPEEPRINLRTPYGEKLLHRGNARLYTHMAHIAMYDHVFVSGTEQESGFYVFKFVTGFNILQNAMIANSFPSYLNMTEVASVDIEAYDRSIQKTIGDIDTIPDDWL